MESLQSLQKRIKTVKNVNKITKAMELVAATKMRKSQEIALLSRPYALAALELLSQLSEQERKLPRILRKREIKKRLIVVVTSDKGLAGSFNSSVLKGLEKFLGENKSISQNSSYMAVGEKAFGYLSSKKLDVVKKFLRVGDYTSPSETNPIADILINGYLTKEWDEIIVFSMQFRSALRQDLLVRKIFPIDMASMKKQVEEIVPERGSYGGQISKEGNQEDAKEDYVIEPSTKYLLEDLAKHLIRMEMYHIVLEANASEHSARRAAMKNASDNASDLATNLNMLYNKSRQSAITREIIEITAGAESINK